MKGYRLAVVGLLGVVATELAVLDYAAMVGVSVEITTEEIESAREVFESDLAEEGEEEAEEVEQ